MQNPRRLLRQNFKVHKKEAKIFPLGKVSLTKPSNLRQVLNTYSIVSQNKQTKNVFCKKCFKYALCGRYNRHKNTVFDKEFLTI